jgi:hypothetical protein
LEVFESTSSSLQKDIAYVWVWGVLQRAALDCNSADNLNAALLVGAITKLLRPQNFVKYVKQFVSDPERFF